MRAHFKLFTDSACTAPFKMTTGSVGVSELDGIEDFSCYNASSSIYPYLPEIGGWRVSGAMQTAGSSLFLLLAALAAALLTPRSF